MPAAASRAPGEAQSRRAQDWAAEGLKNKMSLGSSLPPVSTLEALACQEQVGRSVGVQRVEEARGTARKRERQS